MFAHQKPADPVEPANAAADREASDVAPAVQKSVSTKGQNIKITNYKL